MGHSVHITTPIPTLEEVGKRLKMSKARQERLIEIVRSSKTGRILERHSHRDATGAVDVSIRNGSSATTDSARSKKSKSAATS
jgi:hypothetical protein